MTGDLKSRHSESPVWRILEGDCRERLAELERHEVMARLDELLALELAA